MFACDRSDMLGSDFVQEELRKQGCAGVGSSSPRSCCSYGSGSDRTTVEPDAFDHYQGYLDDDDHNDGLCEADVAVVEGHLEMMNAAADDLNSAQQDALLLLQRRQTAEQRWAAASAGSARSITASSLCKARQCLAQERLCQLAEQAAFAARRSLQDAIEVGVSASQASLISAVAATKTRQHWEEERRLEEALRLATKEGWSIAVKYLEEERDHQLLVAHIDSLIENAFRKVADCKERYQDAMVQLELISEAVHRGRSRHSSRVPTAVHLEGVDWKRDP